MGSWKGAIMKLLTASKYKIAFFGLENDIMAASIFCEKHENYWGIMDKCIIKYTQLKNIENLTVVGNIYISR